MLKKITEYLVSIQVSLDSILAAAGFDTFVCWNSIWIVKLSYRHHPGDGNAPVRQSCVA
jgi:hypothetical protein